jgi:NAD(P)-dependent dehydrogenase (short-subunit alcohol dehydrogenase family)
LSGRLEGKIALVTGAGQGVGLGIARRLHAEGATVVIAEYDPVTGQAAADSLQRADFVKTDITQKTEAVAAVEFALGKYGQLDILVNNAYPTGARPSRMEARTDEELQHGFNGACMSAWWTMQAAFPAMQQNHWGRIINIASLNGVNAHPYTVEYNVGKEALRGLSRTAAREWARHGICVNVICPAASTPAYEMFRSHSPDNAALLLEQNPMGYMGDPEADIGGVAVFLASEDARYLTGNTLFADGGSHINGVNWEPPVA